MGDEDDERRDSDGGNADGDDAEDLHESEEDDACADDGPDTQPVELPEIHLVLLCAQAARPLEGVEKETGGGGGIRTPETRRPNGFRDRRIQPLCHPSARAKGLSRVRHGWNYNPALQKSTKLSA